MKPFRIALLQTRITPNKAENLNFIRAGLQDAGNGRANIAILGQICNSPYQKRFMHEFAEDFGNSETLSLIKSECRKLNMYAIGTIPRRSSSNGETNFFNTAFAINPMGEQIAQFDKIHLFDIDIPGKITYKESETFCAGNKICVFDTEFCKFGIGICYDLRFTELALLMAKEGARVLVYPGSFNLTTGPLHWELLLRGRAVDTQSFVIGVSGARYKEDTSIYQAWGHSTAVDPFGKILVTTEENPAVLFAEIDPNYTEEVRMNIPLRLQRRNDLYSLSKL